MGLGDTHEDLPFAHATTPDAHLQRVVAVAEAACLRLQAFWKEGLNGVQGNGAGKGQVDEKGFNSSRKCCRAARKLHPRISMTGIWDFLFLHCLAWPSTARSFTVQL